MENNDKRARRLAQQRQLARWLAAAALLVTLALLGMLILTQFMA